MDKSILPKFKSNVEVPKSVIPLTIQLNSYCGWVFGLLAVVFVLLNFCDVATTFIALGNPPNTRFESNPFSAWIMDKGGWPLYLFGKWLSMATVLLYIGCNRHKSPGVANIYMGLICLFMCLVVLGNCVVLAVAHQGKCLGL